MKLYALLEQLNGKETYEKENILIDIYIFLIENKKELNDRAKLFVELTKLRDRSLTDGSETYFVDSEDSISCFNLIEQFLNNDFFGPLEKMIKVRNYEKIDEWIQQNEWKYNDELEHLIKDAFAIYHAI